jgi:hypothetical protein
MTSANAQIALRALDSEVVVYNSGSQTINGNKTFSSVSTVGTRTQGDNSTRAASTEFVSTAVATLESNLQTLGH